MSRRCCATDCEFNLGGDCDLAEPYYNEAGSCEDFRKKPDIEESEDEEKNEKQKYSFRIQGFQQRHDL